jgi:GT2 family glycosyltransferase
MGLEVEIKRVAVVVASRNRAEELAQLLKALAGQSLAPSAIVLSVETAADLPADLPAHVQAVFGSRGSSVQRNRGMELVLRESDVVVFFDDDFLPASLALAGVARLFAASPDIAGATGLVLRDGVTEGGLSYHTAQAILADFESRTLGPVVNRTVDGTYGCNMAFRATAIGDVRFDENLPLYGWQEDVDFASRVGKIGRIVQTNAFAGVHIGVNKGRSSGIPLGFSQMVNPVYLVRKGTMSLPKAAGLILRNFLANHVKALAPEPFVDRRGRVRGNWRGIRHMLCGRVDPTEILRF